jgi:para-nitrobenzyl esterase
MLRIANTENGKVRGIPAADPRITAFKGVPFAAPPVGDKRWRAPQPCENWEGTRDCFEFAPISVQDTPGIGDDIYCREWHVDPDIPMGEDCLYLNIWTNAKKGDEKMPVVVWYFGGAFQWGYTAEMEFDGERLARRGIVVVTVNYRLGALGFLAHPQLTAEQPDAPCNFGSLDQQAGLRWVARNIAAFGGDPDNITIAGQSAGGGSVLTQMTCPDNYSLIKKAIVHSAMIYDPYTGGCIGEPLTLAEAEKEGEEFFRFIGAANLAEARKMDALYIRDKYSEYIQNHRMMLPAIDNNICMGNPLKLYMQDKHAQIPIMAGNTADEFLNSIEASDSQDFHKKARELFGDRYDEFLSYIDENDSKDGHYALVNGIECTVKSIFLHNSEGDNPENCYYYRFDADIPGWDDPGTFHSVDLWFFFETLAKCWRPFDGRHYDLARQMCNYWCNFVKTGDPNGTDQDGLPMPEWNTYSKERPFDMVFRTGGPRLEKREDKCLQTFLTEHITKKLNS